MKLLKTSCQRTIGRSEKTDQHLNCQERQPIMNDKINAANNKINEKETPKKNAT